jgi:hypothetical protein
MASFPGGSAWALARDIAAGHFLVTERTFQAFNRGQLDKLTFELDRCLREVRAEQPPLEDTRAVQDRNRRIQRLNTAAMILRSYRLRRKK